MLKKMLGSHWFAVGVGVAVLLWLLSDVNVNASITAGDPILTYPGK